MKILINWLVFLGVVVGAGYGLHHFSLTLPTMSGWQVLFFALSIAFTWVEVLKIGVTKPFTCVKCMTGWIALILAFLFHVAFWPLYLFAGLFVGAMWSGFKMRL